MNIKTQMGWAGFLVALSAFNLPVDAAIAPSVLPTTTTQSSQTSIEGRLSRISSTLKAKESQLPENSEQPMTGDLALGWLNGGGGGFLNRRPWRNGWGDGGGFFNRGFNNGGWGNGGFGNGGFWNRF